MTNKRTLADTARQLLGEGVAYRAGRRRPSRKTPLPVKSNNDADHHRGEYQRAQIAARYHEEKKWHHQNEQEKHKSNGDHELAKIHNDIATGHRHLENHYERLAAHHLYKFSNTD